MSLTHPKFQNVSANDEKSNGLEELGCTPLSNSPVPCLESNPLDGGFRAWAAAFGSLLMQFCGFGYLSSFGVYQDFYTRIYLSSYSPSAISWIGALSACLTLNVTLISGPLYDRGWFYHLMISGSLLQSISLFVLSQAKPGQFYLIFVVQGVLSGIGAGLTYAPSLALVSQYFSKRRTLVMSLVASGIPLGCVIHPIMLNHLLNGPVGFSSGVLISAGFVSSLLLIACLSMRAKVLPTPTASNTAVARKCSRDVLFILMTTGTTLFQIGYFFPLFYMQLDSVKHGISTDFSFYSLVIMNAASFVGRCSTGTIASYTGVLNLTLISTIICGALCISMIALSDTTSVIVISIIYGYFSGIYSALFAPIVTVFTPDLSELGARMGICFAFAAFGALVGGPISGALLSSHYRWLIPSLFSGFISLLGSSLFLVMRLIMYRRGLTE